jgi:hypothetical protein
VNFCPGKFFGLSVDGLGIDFIFEPLEGLELHNPPGGQHHDHSGKWAAPGARFLFTNIEFTEMADFNALTGFKGFFDDFDKVVYGAAGLLLGESRFVGYGPNDIGFCEGHDANYLKD